MARLKKLKFNNTSYEFPVEDVKVGTTSVVTDGVATIDLSGKADDNAVVKLTGNQTIAGTKTFSTSPVVPSKTSAATNTGTAIATEAQVYKKQDKLTAQTAYSAKGTATKVPQITTNNLGQVTGITEVDIQAGETYNAGPGISIGQYQDYSAMRGPCPEGFHIPLRSDYNGLINIMNSLGLNSNGTGWKNYLRMPYAGCRSNNSNVTQQGTLGYYYESEFSGGGGMPFCIYFSDSMGVNSSGGVMGVSSAGYSIRPFYNEGIAPNGGWQVLYQGTGSAGIYWHKDLGLITASSNGTTWVTIADKNLGATTVYNSGDTLSEDNCGGYYQWGNNHMFPFTGTVTTSSTQVNASSYGPGNWYDSSTFITNGNGWDSSYNDNLWGGVTGIITLNNAITNTGVLSVNGQTGNVTVTTHTTITVTLTSAGWSSNSQTVSATGVTASNTVIVSPAPSDIGDYADCGVYCSAQASGTLTFGCDTAPSGDIVVNVLIMS